MAGESRIFVVCFESFMVVVLALAGASMSVTAADLPPIRVYFAPTPYAHGPSGAKGVGELPSIPTSAAITNAIYRATGVRVRSLPVDQDELLRAMRAGATEVELGWGDLSPIPAVTLGGEM